MIDDGTRQLLREAVSAFAKPDPKAARELRETGSGFDREAWRFMAEQGWLAVMGGERIGGADLGVSAAIEIARPLGYGIRAEPFSQLVQSILCLDHSESSSNDTMALVASQIISGKIVPAVCGSFDVLTACPVAQTSGTGFALTGSCKFAEPGNADGAVIAALLEGQPALFWLGLDEADVERKLVAGPDEYPLANIEFSGVTIAKDGLIAKGDIARCLFEKAYDGALIVRAAELLGLIDRVLDITVEYLKTRKQFGQPIGAFQALQHRTVDLWIQRELSEAAITGAAAKYDNVEASVSDRSSLASGALARTAAAAIHICGQAVQLHGAIGTTDEYELALHLKRALRLGTTMGNDLQHRRRYHKFAENMPGLAMNSVSGVAS